MLLGGGFGDKAIKLLIVLVPLDGVQRFPFLLIVVKKQVAVVLMPPVVVLVKVTAAGAIVELVVTF